LEQRTAKKVIVIGIDGLIPEFVRKFSTEGILPNMSKLMRNGIFSELLSAAYADTPTNWTTIATGSWPGTHGINSFGFHIEGEPFDQVYDMGNNLFPIVGNVNTEYFMNRLSKAEYVWQVAEKAGKKVILINWPGGWPPNVKNGLVIDGTGPYSSPICRMGNEMRFSSSSDRGLCREVNRLEIKKAKGWKNVVFSDPPALEAQFDVTGQVEMRPSGEDRWQDSSSSLLYHILIVASDGQRYDKILVCKDKNAAKPVVALKVGEESDWIEEEFLPTIGKRIYANMIVREEFKTKIRGKFKLSLVDLSFQGRGIILERTAIFAEHGWAYPSHVADELTDELLHRQKRGLLTERTEKLLSQKSPLCQVYESVEDMAKGLSFSCKYLTRRYSWDVLFTQIHAPDGINHDELNNLCPESPTYDPENVEYTWEKFRDTYRILDRFLGEIVESCADKNTLVVALSDHGGIPTKKRVALEVFFEKEGLIKLKKNQRGRLVIDLSKSRVVLGINYVTHNIWVNLKGRDPSGIVTSEEYEKVRSKIIDVLYSIKDPETGEHAISLAVCKEHAKDLGQWGDRVGDVLYFFKEGYSNKFTNCITGIDPEDLPKGGFEPVLEGPEFGRHHSFLPSTTYCGCSVKGVFIMSGPGVRKGYVRSFPIRAVDVTPTVCFLSSLPYPAQCEGMIPGDILNIR